VKSLKSPALCGLFYDLIFSFGILGVPAPVKRQGLSNPTHIREMVEKMGGNGYINFKLVKIGV
jgi:hypothetical protein